MNLHTYACSCGSSDAAPVLDHRGDSLWHAQVECPDCDAVGPARQSTDPDLAEADAVSEWNNHVAA